MNKYVVIFHTCSYRCPWCEMPATSMFMSHGFPIKSMGGCGSGTVGRYMAEWWNSAAASEQGSSGLGRGPLSFSWTGFIFLWFGIIGFHLQQHHLSQINRVDPLWAFWFWAVGEASSVWGPRPFTILTIIYIYIIYSYQISYIVYRISYWIIHHTSYIIYILHKQVTGEFCNSTSWELRTCSLPCRGCRSPWPVHHPDRSLEATCQPFRKVCFLGRVLRNHPEVRWNFMESHGISKALPVVCWYFSWKFQIQILSAPGWL